MITSLQNFFLKHNKWLFGGLLVVIIVTFVLTIGPQSFFGSGPSAQRRSLNYYGYDLTSEQDQRAMAYTAEVSAILHPELQLRRDQLMDYAYLRVAGLGMAAQLGIPHPSKEELAGYVESLMIFADPQTGGFSAESYNRMVELMQGSGGFTRESIARALREDYVIDQVKQALGGPDYALPYENLRAYTDRETTYTVTLAHFDYASFNPEIVPGEEQLLQFFNENPARYEIEESLRVKAYFFNAEAYLDEVAEPGETDLQLYFTTNQGRYLPEAKEGEEVPQITLAEVREQVAADWKLAEARKLAARKGESFSLRLWRDGIKANSPEFNALVQEFKSAPEQVEPYTRVAPPVSATLSEQLLDSMWVYANNPNRYFSDAAPTPTGSVVLVHDELTEARMPAFEEVRELVTADFAAAEKRRLFAEQGNTLRGQLLQDIVSTDFVIGAELLGLDVEALETFDGISVPPSLQQGNLWDQTMHLESGEVSPMVISGDRGTFAYMVEKVVPEVDTASAAFQAFLEQRKGALSNAMGWARLREITDNSLSSLVGSSPIGEE